MSLSNNYLSNLGNLGSTKCCDLKGLGPIGPVGPHGPIGPIGPDGTEGVTGFIGPPGKLSTGGYSSYSVNSFSISSDDPKYASFTTVLNGIFDANKYYVCNMSFYFSGTVGAANPDEIDFNITFNVSVEFSTYGTVQFSPSTFFIDDSSIETYPIGMLLTPTVAGSIYSYTATLNDWVFIDPTIYGFPSDANILNVFINARINYQVNPFATVNFRWSSSVTPVN
jgi:hypothetical protein